MVVAGWGVLFAGCSVVRLGLNCVYCYLCWVDGCSLDCSCLVVFDLLWFAGVF